MKKKNKYVWLAYISIILFLLFWLSSVKKDSSEMFSDYPLQVIDNEIRVRENGEVLYRFIPVDGGYMTFSYLSGITKSNGDSINIATSHVNAKREEIRSFLIGETPVSQELCYYVTYGKFTPNYGKNDLLIYFDKYTPSEWTKFIRKLERLTGEKFSIPTSEQWEYAARGGQKSKNFIYAGSNDIDLVAQYQKNTADKHLIIGKCKEPNELGLFDMSGSVDELTSTPYVSIWPQMKYAADSIKQYLDGFVSRGGSVNEVEQFCRVDSRNFCHRKQTVGLRLILEY